MEGDAPMNKPPERLSRRKFILGSSAVAANALNPLGQSQAHAADKIPRVSGWSREILPSDDIANLIDKKYAKEKAALSAFQKKVRSAEFRKVQKDPKQFTRAAKEALADHPDCNFGMLSKEVQEKVRRFYNRSVVWMSRRGDGMMEIHSLGSLAGEKFKQAVRENAENKTAHATLVRRGGEFFLQMNAHVASHLEHRKAEAERAATLEKTADSDIVFYRISADVLTVRGIDPNDAVDITEELPKGFQFHGAPVFCRGFDADKFGDKAALNPNGFKDWFGVLFQTENWMARNFGTSVTNTITQLTKKGYVFRIPDGQATYLENIYPQDPQKMVVLTEAMSGLPLTTEINGKVRMIGIQFCAVPHDVEVAGKKKEFSLSGFHILPDIVAALQKTERIFEFPIDRGLPPTTARAKL